MSIHSLKLNHQKINEISCSLKKKAASLNPFSLVGLDLFRFQQGYLELGKFARQMLLDSFQTMGLLDVPSQEGMSSALSRFYRAALGLLARSVGECEDLPVVGLRRQEYLAQKYPEIRAHLQLLVHCIEHYPQIFLGELTATEVMFPKSSIKKVAGIYKGNPVSDYFNALAAHAALAFIEERRKSLRAGEKIRILEIGAGTGGTSEPVLEAIQPYGSQLEYVYTDISSFFLQYGRSNFEDRYPFMAFDILNIAKDIHDQEFESESFELILATNVLHATPNIKTSLRHVQMLLKPHGWMILNEMTKAQDVLTLTFGLLDGWWLFEDETYRIQDSPLIDAETWRRLFREEGFPQVEILGPDPATGLDLAQNVIVAEKGRPADKYGPGPEPDRSENQGFYILKTPRPAEENPSAGTEYRHCLHYGYGDGDRLEKKKAVAQKYHISLDGNSCIRDHIIFGQHIMPSAAYLEMLYIGTRKLLGYTQGLQVDGVHLPLPMIALPGVSLEGRLKLTPGVDGNHFEIHSKKAHRFRDPYQLNVAGTFREIAETAPETSGLQWDSYEKRLGPREIYAADAILKAGPSYQTIEQIQIQHQTAVSRLRRSPTGEQNRSRFVLEPSIVDGLFATGFYLARMLSAQQKKFFIPVLFERVKIHREIHGNLYYGKATCTSAEKEHLLLNLALIDQRGNQVLSVQGCRLQKIQAEHFYQDSFYRVLFWR